MRKDKKEIRKTPIHPFSYDDILEDVCQTLGYEFCAVRSIIKTTNLVLCRAIFYYVTNYLGSDGRTSKIARYMDKSYTSVMHQRRKIDQYVDVKDKFFIDALNKYKENSKLWKAIFDFSVKYNCSYA